MKSPLLRLIAIATLVLGVIFTSSSCGSQKMGCPGSITKAAHSAPGQS